MVNHKQTLFNTTSILYQKNHTTRNSLLFYNKIGFFVVMNASIGFFKDSCVFLAEAYRWKLFKIVVFGQIANNKKQVTQRQLTYKLLLHFESTKLI